MIDLMKSLKAATIPLVLFVVIGIVTNVLGTFVTFLSCILGIPILIVNAVLVGWAGYKAVKEQKLDLVGGAISGLIVGTVGAIVNGIAGFVLALLLSLSSQAGLVSAGIIGVAAIVSIIFWVIVGIIGGSILGAMGAYVAGMKK